MKRSEYALIDFGDGRKLEQIAGRIMDRPSPSAMGFAKSAPALWSSAESRFDARGKTWRHEPPWETPLNVDCGGFRMRVAPTPFGHIGLFPEQAENWQWLLETAPTTSADDESALNLFGYTGASAMALTAAGMRVAHVDAAKPNVVAAKQNAKLNGFGERPIRYLVDDAVKFSSREVRRGNRYHTIVLDPPAYGHSPKGRAWRLERDVWELLDNCLAILKPKHYRVLFTGHSPQVGPDDVLEYLRKNAPGALNVSRPVFDSGIESGRMGIADQSGRILDAGFFVRCMCDDR